MIPKELANKIFELMEYRDKELEELLEYKKNYGDLFRCITCKTIFVNDYELFICDTCECYICEECLDNNDEYPKEKSTGYRSAIGDCEVEMIEYCSEKCDKKVE